MTSVFNIEKLRGILKDFYEITRIRLTVFDPYLHELVSYPEEVSSFCKIVRSCESGRNACAACDKKACTDAALQRRTQMYRCHAGLTEVVTPIVMDDVLLGYLFFGHVFSYPDYESGWAEIKSLCKNLPIDFEKLKTACLERPLLSGDFIRSSTHIMLAVASYLVIERMVTLKQDSLSVRLDGYLSEHFTEKLSASELCRIFGIGKTQLYKLSNNMYGCGIAEHLRALRIDKAKRLLSSAQMPLSQIAQECGYDDYNYFIAVFSRAEGCPPGVWKKRLESPFSNE